MQKWWSIFFGVVLAATFGLWIAAPFCGWWLPPNVASYGGDVDGLFYIILGFTGFFFLLTEIILVYAMYRYSAKPGHKSDYTHGNHKLEIFWTAVPAAILLFIAFAQIKAWESIKYQSRMPPPEVSVQVTARQWEWRMRYPALTSRFNYPTDAGPTEVAVMRREALRWAEVAEYDDIHVANELHVWQGANVKIYLRTLDVLHSFYLPNLRLKQDALPGKTIPMWFRATASNTVRFEGAGDWLGNKDPQLWREEQKLIRLLLDEAAKRDQLAIKEKAAANAKLSREDVAKLQKEIAALQKEADDLADKRQQADDQARAQETKNWELGALDKTKPGALRAKAAEIRSFGHSSHSWEIACAELCGTRHAYMRGRLYVHPTPEDFEAWLAHAYSQQRSRQP